MGKTYLQGELLTATDLNDSLNESVKIVETRAFSTSGTVTISGGLTVDTTPTDFNSISRFYNNIVVSSGNITLSTGSLTATQGNITASQGNIIASQGGITATNGSITDKIGNIRKVPLNSAASGYTLAALDVGKTVSISSGSVTVPANVFTAGDNVTIYNSSTSASLTITQGGGLTMYWAGQTSLASGNRILSFQGLCTILFTSASAAVITGSGLT